MKSLIPLSIACMISTSAVAASTDLKDLNKDLEIMSTILKTSLKQSTREVDVRVRNVKSTYLSGQGAVFSVSTSGHSMKVGEMFNGFHIELPDLPELPEVPDVSEVITHSDGDSIVIDIGEDFEFIAAEAMEQAREGLRVAREKIRELRFEERDLNYEQRDLVRRKRDIEFESKRADDERKKELADELKEIDAELAKLDGERKEVKKYVIKLESERKEKVKEQLAQRKASRTQFLAAFEEALADTLCSYGAGLKAMSNDEKVNVILERFGEEKTKRNNANQDRIYVFNKSDIKSCVADKINADKLLEKAKVYYF